MEKIELLFNDIITTLQIAKLYGVEHLRFKKYLDNTYEFLSGLLRERDELILGIVDDELAFEKEIFFDLSRRLKIMISYLKDRHIEKIVFSRGLEKEELQNFFSFLTMRKEEVRQEPQKHLSALKIAHIRLERLQGGAAAADGSKGEGAGGSGGQKGSGPLLQALSGLAQSYEGSLEQATQAIETVISQGDIDYLSLRFSMSHITENLIANYQELLKLASIKRYDFNTFVHILNVSILSMYFAFKLGLPKNDIIDIGTAALFHDIGKLYISRQIIQKKDQLTDEEFGQIKSHVLVGAELLLKYVDTLGMLPVVVCFEHHLKYNVKGYPKLSFFLRPHIASRIISICDVYDALSARRSYKKSYPPKLIYEIMQKEAGTSFETELLRAFFRIIGVWPIGSVVLLTDDSIAVVRGENEDDIFSPQVEVIMPAEKSRCLNLKENKGTLEIKEYLDPLNDAKDYRHLI